MQLHTFSLIDSHTHTCAHRADCKTLISEAAAFLSETRSFLCRTSEVEDIRLFLAKDREEEREMERQGEEKGRGMEVGVLVGERLPVTTFSFQIDHLKNNNEEIN